MAAAPEPTAVARGHGVLIVRNTRSGTAVIRADPAELIAERLPEADVRELGEGEDLADVVDTAMAATDPPSVLGVYGGDGSVSRMAELARKHDRLLLVMPGGTFNHFARSAGVVDVETAIDALESGSTVEVSAVEVTADDGPPVLALNAVSVGAYPELIDQRDRRRARLGKWLGGIVAAWITLRSAEPLTIVREGRRARVWSVFVGVGRSDPMRVATMQRENLEEPTLDVRIHHASGTRMRAIASLAFGKRTAAVLHALKLMPPRSDVERLVVPGFDMTVCVEPERPSVYVHDGELEERPAGGFRLRCVIVPRAVTVYAPGSEAR
ncbi:diacylglycerol/lipid kinase family protein [Microbacterium immunditiarum]|uniref:Diacylglycerol kinase family enzyme n=1 Tax=Microbacterium immunditiarum TaxID=337480 RepID=A0A7Y9GRJ3_9MICO|nr:diacylglycerol kinase family protein [Microbacterium immunditiarum]NYE21390.1 diacylglycerol kinase family enzyme [Microbacterium immunditiarum]